MKEKIHALDGLRGFCAIWVLMHHLREMLGIELAEWMNVFSSPVNPILLFFLMSGFVIAALLESKKERYPAYLLRRYFRLAPALLAYCVIYLLLTDVIVTVLRDYLPERVRLFEDSKEHWPLYMVLKSSLFYGFFSPIFPYSASSIIPPAWSITIEWQFYVLAPLLVFACKKHKAHWLALAFILFSVVRNHYHFYPVIIDKYVPYFLVGIASYYYFTRKNINVNRAYISVMLLVLTFLPSLYFLLFGKAIVAASLILPYLVWFAAMFVIFSSSDTPKNNIIMRFLESRLMQKAGEASYSFYLLHMLGIYITLYLIDLAGFPSVGGEYYWVVLVCAFAITYCASRVGYRYIEKPFIDKARLLAKRFS